MPERSGSKLRIYSGFATDVGKVRDRNEDAFYQGRVRLGYLAVVADGMGEQGQDDSAASTTVSAFAAGVSQDATHPVTALQQGFALANQTLRYKSAKAGVSLGATCVAALICGGYLYVGHVGDARLYLLRGANLYALTRDHSLMQEIADIKGPVAATSFAASLRRVMSRSVGADKTINPTLRKPIALAAGDTILLCTDGLPAAVDERRIQLAVAGATPREAATRLVQMANESGGDDNVTVIVLRVDADVMQEQGFYLTLDELMGMFVLTSDGDQHPVVDVRIDPSSWAVTALQLDLRNVKRGAQCRIPISEIGPIASTEEPITTPQRTEALLDMHYRAEE